MYLYKKVLENEQYLKIVSQIESIRFITDGKWDWEHGLGHYKRVARYVENILKQMNEDERTIELGMVAALLHDIGLIKGNKVDHALESSRLFVDFIEEDLTEKERKVLEHAIKDHSDGKSINSMVGMALVLADKLDVTYHRTINSSIQDVVNKEIQKIKFVDIKITSHELILNYETEKDFDVLIMKVWPKAITLPYKIANFLNKKYVFAINGNIVDISNFVK